MSRKKTIEEVREYVESQGYELLSDEYVNNRTKLKFKCPEGHEYASCWDSFRREYRCLICDSIRKSKRAKHSFEYIKNYIEHSGYLLLSNTYSNYNTKLKFRCPNGHIYCTKWTNFKSGSRCPKCFFKKIGNLTRTPFEKIKNFISKQGFKLLEKEYINNSKKMKIECSRNHIFYTSWNCFRRGTRCPICARIDYSINYSGQNSPLWRGGSLDYPHFFNKNLKKEIKNRDKNKCLNPNCPFELFELRVHHIDYNKENCDKSNLVSLCISCHAKSNFNRNYWTEFYQNLLHEKYGYIYENIEKENYKCLEIQ